LRRLPAGFRTIETARDVRLIRLDSGRVLAVSCDSAGGIGPKPLDRVKVDAYTVGRFTVRVALMEVLSVGAEPICLANTLAVEPNPTGNQIIKGIREEAEYAGVDPRIPMTYSTEKNVHTRQTGVGVTVVGTTLVGAVRIGRCRPGDSVVAVGLPHVGHEVLRGEKERMLADSRDVRILLKLSFVHEIIPVGSQGILNEARTLAEDSNLRFKLVRSLQLDARKSAGPATVVLCTCPQSYLRKLSKSVEKPVNLVGILH
jgi:thiamine monophosphate kinase